MSNRIHAEEWDPSTETWRPVASWRLTDENVARDWIRRWTSTDRRTYRLVKIEMVEQRTILE